MKKPILCELCGNPVNLDFAMSDQEGNKAHIYCVAKTRGLSLLVRKEVQDGATNGHNESRQEVSSTA